MSYQTGSYSSPSNLLGILRAFLSSNGWTENEFDAGNNELHVSKNGIYWNLKSYNSVTDVWDYRFGGPKVSVYGIGAYLSTGYSAAAGWDAQPGHAQIRTDTGDINDVGHPLNCKASGTYFMHSYSTSDDIFIAVQPSDGLDPQTVMMAIGKLEPHDDVYMASSIGSYANLALPTGFFAYSNDSGTRCLHQGSVLVYALDPDTGTRFWGSNSCYAGVGSRPYQAAAPVGMPLCSTSNSFAPSSYADILRNYGMFAVHLYLGTPNELDVYRTSVPLTLRMHRHENEELGEGGYSAYPRQMMCCSVRSTSPLLEYSIGSDTWKAYPNYTSAGLPAHYILVKKEV